MRSSALLILAFMLQTEFASATYSVIAVDSETKQVGGAVTSCVGGVSTSIVLGTVPGFGVLAAQAQVDQVSLLKKNKALNLLKEGESAQTISSFLADLTSDPFAAARQHAVVTLTGTAVYNGSAIPLWSGNRSSTVGHLHYSIQGNTLTSEQVLTQTEDALRTSTGELAARLLRAIEAGGENGQGDSRCTLSGKPSNSAYLIVLNADGRVDTEIDVVGSDSALSDLRLRYDKKAKK